MFELYKFAIEILVFLERVREHIIRSIMQNLLKDCIRYCKNCQQNSQHPLVQSVSSLLNYRGSFVFPQCIRFLCNRRK